MKNTVVKLVVALLLFDTVHCVAFQDVGKPQIDTKFISSVNEFGFNLLKSLSEKESKNIFISPVSIFYALSIVNNGAAGSTNDSIRATLHVEEFDKDWINQSNSMLLSSLMAEDTSVELNIANSLWIDIPFELRPEFVYECTDKYSAEALTRDFTDQRTVDDINEWVKNKTRGKIENIINQLKEEEVLVILNAIYFYGKWTTPFDSSRTKLKPFMLQDGSEKEYPRMYRSDSFRYFENGEFQFVSIPYGKRFNMCVALPREQNGLNAFLNNMSAKRWSGTVSRSTMRHGQIGMPKFKIEYATSLADPLKNLGMGIAFHAGADFSLMAQSPVMIGDVIHKTYLDVNEKGTEAAAVTKVEIGFTDALRLDPPKPFEMIVDHPFFLVITDDESGVILFAGAIVDPKFNAK